LIIITFDKVRFYFLYEAHMFKIKSRNALWFWTCVLHIKS